MAGPSSIRALTDGELRARRERLTDFLDVWGDLRVSDLGALGGRRLLAFALTAPGEALPVEVKAAYREYYRRGRDGRWTLAKYHYEYLDVTRATRLAYHLHDIGPRRLVAHAHCEPAEDLTDEESTHHYRAIEVDLREAHEAFMKLWATDLAPDRTDLLPLEIPRG